MVFNTKKHVVKQVKVRNSSEFRVKDPTYAIKI